MGIQPFSEILRSRTVAVEGLLRDELPWIHVLMGPRQVGKSTAARQIASRLGWPVVSESADSPVPLGPEWIHAQWSRAAAMAGGERPALLILDEWRPGVQARRGSSPKLVVLNNALSTALSARPRADLDRDRSWRGRLVENAVIAHVFQGLEGTGARLRWWRDRNWEVDLVVESPRGLWALEIRSGKPERPEGLREFLKRWPRAEPLVVGSGGIPFEEFLAQDPRERFGG